MIALYVIIVAGSAALSNWILGSWVPGLALGLIVAVIVVAMLRARRPAPPTGHPEH